MRLYHFACKKYGLDNALRRRLKIARIEDLNDPFEFMARAADERERAALRATKEERSKKTGLLCFSRGWQNPVQWSHYADRHRGVCLGFDVDDSQIRQVDYRKSPLQFERRRFLSDASYAQDFSERLVSTKFEDWRYEEEFRLFVNLDPATESNGLYFYELSDQLRLAELIVGAGSTITREQVNAALGSLARQVEAKKARMAFRSYRIVEQRDPDRRT